MDFKPTPVSYKNYQCSQCGHVHKIQTNHYGQCYGQALMRLNMCPECSWKHPMDNIVWTCLESAPSPENVPEPWKISK